MKPDKDDLTVTIVWNSHDDPPSSTDRDDLLEDGRMQWWDEKKKKRWRNSTLIPYEWCLRRQGFVAGLIVASLIWLVVALAFWWARS